MIKEDKRRYETPNIYKSLDRPKLNMAKDKFTFPYGFKHGVVLEITEEECKRLKLWK